MNLFKSTHKLALASTVLLGVVCPADALACPGGYSFASCNSVCTRSGDVWTCDLTANGDTSGGVINVVRDASTGFCEGPLGSQDYCAWGTDASGSGFCCRTDSASTTSWASGMCEVDVLGGEHDDTIDFNYDTDALQLEYNTGCATDFLGLTDAGNGADDIEGSGSAYYYSEYHDGGPADDNIDLRKSDNTTYGGAGADTIFTGSGVTLTFGQDGPDTIEMGTGGGTVNGGDGNDKISGSSQGDVLNGNAGNDTICGENSTFGADALDGGLGDDTLWDTDAGDTIAGAGGTDSCGDSSTTRTTCEGAVLGTKPAACP